MRAKNTPVFSREDIRQEHDSIFAIQQHNQMKNKSTNYSYFYISLIFKKASVILVSTNFTIHFRYVINLCHIEIIYQDGLCIHQLNSSIVRGKSQITFSLSKHNECFLEMEKWTTIERESNLSRSNLKNQFIYITKNTKMIYI